MIILIVHLSKKYTPAFLINSRIKLIGVSIAQTIIITITSVFFGMFYHFSNETGFLANANATTSIQQAHQGNFIHKITKEKVEGLLGTDTVFIDARLSRDYEAGHLEGAISVPIDCNDIERREATLNIAKGAQIVMYCQSAGCRYAEIVAIKLKEDGFTNISIYKGGWADWEEKNLKKKDASL